MLATQHDGNVPTLTEAFAMIPQTDLDGLQPKMSGVTSTEPMATSPSRRTPRTSFTAGRRTSRVEKSRSAHSSPRTVERRKTTSAVYRYATLEDHWDMMFGGKRAKRKSTAVLRQSERPMSWHPTSSTSTNSSHHPTSFAHFDSRGPVPTGSTSRTSVGVHSMAPDPQHPSPVPSNPSNETFPATMVSHDAMICTSAASQPVRLTTALKDGWSQPVKSHVVVPVASADKDFLPIQYPSGSLISKTNALSPATPTFKPTGKVLVGMGLYDPPETSSIPTRNSFEVAQGKGLKLEETWQPPLDQADDEPVEDAADSEEEGSDDELPNVAIVEQSDRHVSVNLTGHSFFFEDEESFSNDCWLQQLRFAAIPEIGLDCRWH